MPPQAVSSAILPTPSIPSPSSPAIPSPSSPTIPTPSTPAPPTPPTQPDSVSRNGLKLSTTIGVGVGLAVVCIIIFTIVFVCVRRRRRKFGFKRKERMEKKVEGETPDEEIAMKLKSENEIGVPEMAGAEVKTANASAVEADGNVRAEVAGTLLDDKKESMGNGTVSELPLGTETEVQELPGQEQAHEVGEGAFFVAELDSTEIARRKSLKATRPPVDGDAAPPVPTAPSTQQDATVPKIVVEEPEEKKA